MDKSWWLQRPGHSIIWRAAAESLAGDSPQVLHCSSSTLAIVTPAPTAPTVAHVTARLDTRGPLATGVLIRQQCQEHGDRAPPYLHLLYESIIQQIEHRQ